MRNDQSRPRVPNRVTIWLTCGCRRHMKDRPTNYTVTYPCPSNMGHGYRLRWTRWVDGDRSGHNPKL